MSVQEDRFNLYKWNIAFGKGRINIIYNIRNRIVNRNSNDHGIYYSSKGIEYTSVVESINHEFLDLLSKTGKFYSGKKENIYYINKNKSRIHLVNRSSKLYNISKDNIEGDLKKMLKATSIFYIMNFTEDDEKFVISAIKINDYYESDYSKFFRKNKIEKIIEN